MRNDFGKIYERSIHFFFIPAYAIIYSLTLSPQKNQISIIPIRFLFFEILGNLISAEIPAGTFHILLQKYSFLHFEGEI